MSAPIRYQVFVYGTLRSGQHNHGILENSDAAFVGDTKVGGFMLVDLGAFPCVFPTYDKEQFCVKGEVYSVDAQTLSRLDHLEGVLHNHYMRQTIDTEWGRVFIYVMHPSRFRGYLSRNVFWVVDGDYSDPESLLLEEHDINTYIDHVYLTAAKWPIPSNYRELQPVVIESAPSEGEKEDKEEAPPTPLALAPQVRQYVPFDWSKHYPPAEEAS